MSATVDIVIVAYSSRDAIADVVEAAAQVPGAGQVVVVDNGSDGSAAVAAAAGAQAIEQPWNPGFGAGQNAGVGATSSPYVLMVNPDADLIPDAIAAGTALLGAEPDAGAVQGAILGRDGQPERSRGRELGPLHLWGRALGAKRLLRYRAGRALAGRVPQLSDHAERVPDAPVDVAWLAATVLLVRRTAFEAAGGFDEAYFLYGEDLDLCRRLRATGWRLVALPDVWAHHDSGASSSSWWDRELVWWQGTMLFAARWWTPAAWMAALGAATVRWVVLGVGRPRSAARAWRALVGDARSARGRRQPNLR